MFRTTLRAGLGTLVVAVSLALVAPSAQAAPTPTPTPAPTSKPTAAPQKQAAAASSYHYKFTTSGNLGEKLTVIGKVLKEGGQTKGHLDWSDAKKYFGDHTTWRDDFAAGFQASGGTLDNAAASTKSRLKTRWNDAADPAVVRSDAQKKGGTNCTGVTKGVPYSGSTKRSENWYDSCDTNVIIERYSFCTLVSGYAIGKLKGYLNAIPPAVALFCGLSVADVVRAKSNSNVAAIKYYNYHIYSASGKSAGQYYVDSTLYSQ